MQLGLELQARVRGTAKSVLFVSGGVAEQTRPTDAPKTLVRANDKWRVATLMSAFRLARVLYSSQKKKNNPSFNHSLSNLPELCIKRSNDSPQETISSFDGLKLKPIQYR